MAAVRHAVAVAHRSVAPLPPPTPAGDGAAALDPDAHNRVLRTHPAAAARRAVSETFILTAPPVYPY